YPVRIGESAADDASGGVLVSAVSEIVRGTQYATGSTIPDGNLLSSNTRATVGGLAISATAAGPTDPVTGGTPTNSNLSAGYFPFANGWLGGTVSSSTANADGSFGTLDTLVASGGIALGTNVQPDFDAQMGVSKVTIPGVTDSNRQGILVASVASKVGRWATVAPSLDGDGYIVRTPDNDGFFEPDPTLDPSAGGEGDGFTTPYSFVFVPVGTPDLTFGRVATNGSSLVEGEQIGVPLVQSGADFSVTSNNLVAPGRFRLEIDGFTPADGTLIVTPVGATENPGGRAADNVLTYESDATGWTILSQDVEGDFLTGNGDELVPLDGTGQAANGSDPYFNFVFIPNNVGSAGPGAIPAVETLTNFNSRTSVIGWNAEITALSTDNGNDPGDVAAFVAGGGAQQSPDVRIDLYANRGDISVSVDGEYLNRRKGLLLTTVNEGLRNNTASGGQQEYGVTMTTAFDEEWSVVTAAADNISGSDEHNLNFAAAYFGADSGFQMAVGEPFDESFAFGDPYETTKIDVDLPGVNVLTDGVLIATPFGNDDNFASATPKGDGSGWEIRVFDNTYDAQTDLRTEPDAASWLYIPYDETENLFAAGLVDSDGTIVSSSDGLGTEWTLVREEDGFGFPQYRLSFTDAEKNPENGMLLLTPTGDFDSQANNENRDNSMLYETDGNDFLIRGIDHISDGQTDLFVDFQDTGFMFAYVDFDSPIFIEAAPMFPGDANGDGTVDLLDLDILGSNFGTTEGAGFADGDFNGDGAVDLLDLDILGGNFGQSASAVAVPEPSAMVLVTLAGLAIWRRR
ncbi:MAG: dockerin type I domain-containing protein, partial [Planctomycetota bacterium]